MVFLHENVAFGGAGGFGSGAQSVVALKELLRCAVFMLMIQVYGGRVSPDPENPEPRTLDPEP